MLPTRLPRPGDHFAGLQIEREIARGGGGAVFVAMAQNGERYAIKLFLGDRRNERLQRFQREIEIGTELKHPGLVEVLGSGEEQGCPYLVMELLEGALPLDRYVEEKNVPARECVRLVMEAAQAINAAHQSTIVHRDVKPDNILVTPAGRVKVVDFGIAKQRERERLTQSGAMLGTLHYMSPEQVNGRSRDVNERTDVYALGATLFRIVVGDEPFRGSTAVQVMAAIVKEPVPDLSQLVTAPAGLSEVVQMAMAKAGNDRYANAGEFARDLAAVYAGAESEAARRALASQHAQATVSIGRRTTPIGALALIVMAAALVFWSTRGPDPEQTRKDTGTLNKATWELLASPESITEEAAQIAGLVERAERLDAPNQASASRARERAFALSGLLALAKGDVEGATKRVLPESKAPAQGALRGALAAVSEGGDAALGKRLLSRAIGRGMQLPELYGWRALASRRAGLDTKAQGLAVVSDLAVLEKFRGALTPDELGIRVNGLIAAERYAEAKATLAAGAEPARPLQWTLAFARAWQSLDTGPTEALRSFDGLGPPAITDSRCRALTNAASQRIAKLLAPLGVGQSTREQVQQVIAWLRLARYLRADDPLAAVRERMLDEATSLRLIGDGRVDLLLALSEVFPDTLEIQAAVVRMRSLISRNVKDPGRLLPATRRALALTTDPLQIALIRMQLFQLLADQTHDAAAQKEALEHSARALEHIENPEARSEILTRRSALFSRQKNPQRALREIRQAIELTPAAPQTATQYTRALLDAKRYSEFLQATTHLSKCAAGDRGFHGEALILAWAATQVDGGADVGRRGIEHLLSIRPIDAGWWVRLAQLQLNAGDREAALASLIKAGAHAPEHSQLGPLKASLLGLAKRAAQGTLNTSELDGVLKKLEAKRRKNPYP